MSALPAFPAGSFAAADDRFATCASFKTAFGFCSVLAASIAGENAQPCLGQLGSGSGMADENTLSGS
jgi:hypothetical protein